MRCSYMQIAWKAYFFAWMFWSLVPSLRADYIFRIGEVSLERPTSAQEVLVPFYLRTTKPDTLSGFMIAMDIGNDGNLLNAPKLPQGVSFSVPLPDDKNILSRPESSWDYFTSYAKPWAAPEFFKLSDIAVTANSTLADPVIAFNANEEKLLFRLAILIGPDAPNYVPINFADDLDLYIPNFTNERGDLLLDATWIHGGISVQTTSTPEPSGLLLVPLAWATFSVVKSFKRRR